MATIQKRGDYSFRALVRMKGHPSKSRTFITKKDAERWAKETEIEIERGIFIDYREAQRTTLKEALERYSNEISPFKKSEKREIGRIKWWQKQEISNRSLASLKGSDFATIRNLQRNAGLAENTIRLKLVLISHLFEVARKEWGMSGLYNPIKDIRLPAGSNQRKRRLEKDEEVYLLRAIEVLNAEAPTIIELAIETAMRQGEILDLKWSQVNFNNKSIFIEGKVNSQLDNKGTKNNCDKNVPLSPRAIELLMQLFNEKKVGKIFSIKQDRLIRLFQKACIDGRAIYLSENKVVPENFLKDLTFHDMRHEATSRLFEKYNFGVMEVKAVTGHKTLSMLTRYTHLKARDLAEKMSNHVNGE